MKTNIQDMKERIDKEEETQISHCRKLNELKSKYARTIFLPELQKLVGKCFRYQNSYSCPKTPKDYWWMYS
jgi:hypothetical protein